MKTRMIEIADKQIIGSNIYVIVECNEYDQYARRINQFSRSEFVFPSTMTDEEIVTSIRNGEYSIYF